MSAKTWLFTGAVLGLLAVALGAFGAHGLEKAVTNWGLTAEEQVQRLDNWEVAVRYQMYHALALVLIGTLSAARPRIAVNLAGGAWTFGILVFSGCLYLYVLTGWRPLGMIVPIGGVALLIGWLALAIAGWNIQSSENAS
jgi:uncharacterized membrane protein YgdD (TMEM256/DUF423 family)